MKKAKKGPNVKKAEGTPEIQNTVAKHLRTYNKSQTHKDRKKAAKRGAIKHKGKRFTQNMPLAA